MSIKFYPLQLDPNRKDRAAQAPMRLMATHAATILMDFGNSKADLASLCGSAAAAYKGESDQPPGPWITCIRCQRIAERFKRD